MFYIMYSYIKREETCKLHVKVQHCKKLNDFSIRNMFTKFHIHDLGHKIKKMCVTIKFPRMKDCVIPAKSSQMNYIFFLNCNINENFRQNLLIKKKE